MYTNNHSYTKCFIIRKSELEGTHFKSKGSKALTEC